MIQWQHEPGKIADAAKPLTSVGETCDNDNLVIFSKTGGAIYNLSTQNVTPFPRINKNYEFSYWILDGPVNASPFGGQGR